MSARASQSLSGHYPQSTSAGRRRARLVEGGARAANPQGLSLADVQALQDDRSPASRAALAAKFGRQYHHLVEGHTRPLAEAVLELLAKDADQKVRQALAEAAASSANMPHGIACRLARDEIEVARPILAHSPVLTDDDLAEIVHTCQSQYALAVASRKRLSEGLCDVLAETNEAEVVVALTGNAGAQLSLATLRRIAQDYWDDRAIQDRLAKRPAAACERDDRLFAESVIVATGADRPAPHQ
jgi:uncharacterized protein (DUF2336 family)